MLLSGLHTKNNTKEALYENLPLTQSSSILFTGNQPHVQC